MILVHEGAGAPCTEQAPYFLNRIRMASPSDKIRRPRAVLQKVARRSRARTENIVISAGKGHRIWTK